MVFTDAWFPKENAEGLAKLLENPGDLPNHGLVVELGCWEGESSAFIAKLLPDRTLICIDWFKGNLSEDEDHPTVRALALRDIREAFQSNMRSAGAGNYLLIEDECLGVLKDIEAEGEVIAFAYVDASHDFKSVKAQLEQLDKMLLPNGIVCGDDYQWPSVSQAVSQVFPDHGHNHNFWFHRKGL